MPPTSWLSIPPSSHFSLSNIPFGIITSKFSQVEKRPAVAIGDHVLDLKAFAAEDGFSKLPSIQDHLTVFSQPTLNAFAALGRPLHREVRSYIQEILSASTSWPEILKENETLRKAALLPKHETKTHLPMKIGDYTDFFAGRNHAFHLGTMFRVCPSRYHIMTIYWRGTTNTSKGSGECPPTELHALACRLPWPSLDRRSLRYVFASSQWPNST